jgi:hypothetical protein
MGWDPQAVNTINILKNKSTFTTLSLLSVWSGFNKLFTCQLTLFTVGKERIDLIIHNGDLSYSDGVQHRFDGYMRDIEYFAAQIPYMVCSVWSSLNNQQITLWCFHFNLKNFFFVLMYFHWLLLMWRFRLVITK